MATITKSCPQCGTQMRLKLPERALARRWTERIGVLCSGCAERQEAADEASRHAERREAATASCGLPNALRGLLWDGMDTSEARAEVIDAAQRWARGELSGLLVCGPTGTGKTRLIATALWDRIQRGNFGRYISVAQLMAMERAGFGTDEKSEATKLLTGHAAIVLDDLDKVGRNETVRSLLYLAIDNRIEAAAPLLVTSNLKPDQIASAFGEAIASRLLGECEVHVLAGADRRQPVAA